jgi:hypothetical protein
VVAVGTVTVVTVKVALVAPAEIVTLAGTEATAELLLSETTAPPMGAGPFSATVPIEGVPPVTLAGFNVSAVRLGPDAGGVLVSKALCCTPAYDPEIVLVVVVVTALVFTTKLALVAPPGMVTFAGTIATEVSLLDRETTTPLPGAALLRVTVPVDGFPPLTLVGLTVSEVRVGAEVAGVTVSMALC